MLSWCVFFLSVMALFPAAPQLDKKALRVFVEGDSSAIPSMIEEMRKRGKESGIEFTFVGATTAPYDVRIIVTAGAGTAWDTTPHHSHPVTLAFSSVVALTPEGRTIFTASRSEATPKAARAAVAAEVARKLYECCGVLKDKGPAAPSEQQSSGPVPGLPAEPGVYYNGPAGWVRLEENSESVIKANGVGAFMLTWGASAVRVSQVYSGPHAPLQIFTGKPTFYVRSYPISERDVAIVRFEKKKDRREIRVGSVTAFKSKTGYSGFESRRIPLKFLRVWPGL
jgi:hypothetical protein